MIRQDRMTGSRRKDMNKEQIETIVKAIDKGFKADSTDSLGAVYRDAKKYLEEEQ